MKRTQTIIVLLFLCNFAFSQQENNPQKWLEWINQNLPAVAEWTDWQERTGELPPDFATMPTCNLLPDPFTFYDGTAVPQNIEKWNVRRAEILELFERYVTGTFPPKPKQLGKIEILDETQTETYMVRNVRVHFGENDKGNVRIRLVIPKGNENEKFPVLISPNLQGWASSLVRREYISAGYAGNDFMDDAAALKDLYPDYDFATLPRRAWLAQIVVDYLETVEQVDMRYIGIFGYSRDGKMATYAAALDKRITALIAGSTGVGGVVPWRFSGERGGGEGIETTTRMFPSWFVSRLRYFSGREDKLPVDANLLMALVAPRPALYQWGLTDQVVNGWSMEQAVESAGKVYAIYGKTDKLNLMHVPGFHGSNDQDACIDFLDIQFGRSAKKWQYQPVFPWNFDEWKKLSGEALDLSQFSEFKSNKKAIKIKDWNDKKTEILKQIKWALGDVPPKLEASSIEAPMRRGNPPSSPTALAKGNIGNPGQLQPDVPAWVLAQSTSSYGFPPADNTNLDSKRIRFGEGITGDLYFPKDKPENTKLKTVIWLHGFHYPLGYMWVYRSDLHPILALVNEGFAVLAFDQSGFGSRTKESAQFYNRFPHWSRMGKMVEDVSAAVDFLSKDEMVNTEHISLLGHTLGGSVALYAAALDERIESVVAISGFTPMRTDISANGTSGMTRYSHLYGLMPRLGFFADNEQKLPYDFEDVISLIAPRRVLIVQPKMDRDANVNDVQSAINQAKNIYKILKAEEKIALQIPNDYGQLSTKTQNNAINWLKNN